MTINVKSVCMSSCHHKSTQYLRCLWQKFCCQYSICSSSWGRWCSLFARLLNFRLLWQDMQPRGFQSKNADNVMTNRQTPRVIAIYNIIPKIILNSTPAKARLIIIHGPVTQSFWSYTQSTAVLLLLLPCSVQNIKTIQRWLNLRYIWVSRDILYCNRPLGPVSI